MRADASSFLLRGACALALVAVGCGEGAGASGTSVGAASSSTSSSGGAGSTTGGGAGLTTGVGGGATTGAGGGTAGVGGSTSGEPSCPSGPELVHRDDFESYVGSLGKPWVTTPTGVSLTTGHGGGQAVRTTYSPADFSPAIELGFADAPHVVVSYWYRVDPGFDPAADDPTGSGMKWFTIWRQNDARQTWGVSALAFPQTGFSTHDNSSPDMPNGDGSMVGDTIGPAGAFLATNDGAWHRYTAEAYTGTGTDGFERLWVDGALLFDSTASHYTRSTEGFALVKFPSDMVSPPASTHTVDIDDFCLWTP